MVHDFINHPHGIELPCSHSLVGETEQIPLGVDLLRQFPRRTEIGEDNIAIQSEERVFDLVAVTGIARYVEFSQSWVTWHVI
ncbi:MAG: hypothetical protein BWY63_03454 [Chloroflexi bacterium ADurb.Bin360]|nr:MAG: hypothetical protein BWY63_03454 [Chloroflexi bacterium ADurb.Bin360]